MAEKAALANPKVNAYDKTPITYVSGLYGKKVIPRVTAAINVPAPKYASHLPDLSAIHPPATLPITHAMALSVPVTRATASALTCQSVATDDHRLLAAPIPMGRRITIMVKIATGERRRLLISTTIIRNLSFMSMFFSTRT